MKVSRPLLFALILSFLLGIGLVIYLLSQGCEGSSCEQSKTEDVNKIARCIMERDSNPITVLVADDDPEDRMLIEDAFEESRLANTLEFVEDGEELLDYLHRRNGYSDPSASPRPGLILLDLNMPRKDGREALNEIKSDPHLRQIPVVVMTTSKAEEDILRTYDLGVNSFVTKPVTFEGLVDVVRTLGKYWFQIVELPPDS